MDLNKEIKLSDLFRRKRGPEAEEKPEKKPRKSRVPRRKAKEPAPALAPARERVPLMRAVNLMPSEGEGRDGKGSLPLLRVGVALFGLLVLAGLAAGFVLMSARAGDLQGQADERRIELAELVAAAAATAQGGEAPSLAGEQQARTVALADALAGRIAWDRILREVSLVLPEDVWVTTISSVSSSTDSESEADPTALGTFTITGSTTSQEQVALFLARLSVIPEFTRVQLQSSSRVEAEDEAAAEQSEEETIVLYEFSIVATVGEAEVAS